MVAEDVRILDVYRRFRCELGDPEFADAVPYCGPPPPDGQPQMMLKQFVHDEPLADDTHSMLVISAGVLDEWLVLNGAGDVIDHATMPEDAYRDVEFGEFVSRRRAARDPRVLRVIDDSDSSHEHPLQRGS